jgi:copper(I)-binding protein
VDFAIPADQSSVLTESGTYLRLVGLKFPLQVGREYPLTLVFRKAGPVLAKLSIDYARFG